MAKKAAAKETATEAPAAKAAEKKTAAGKAGERGLKAAPKTRDWKSLGLPSYAVDTRP